jgi:hypothetical protein
VVSHGAGSSRSNHMNASGQPRRWTLIGPDGAAFDSPRPGRLGGHRGSRIYGRLDCPAALRAIRAGGYGRDRVFFASVQDAVAAGYRPCAVCLPGAYARWKAAAVTDRLGGLS